MTEAEWLACDDPMPMVRLLWHKVSNRQRRLFVVACAHCIWDRIPTGDMREAVATAERYADSSATPEEFYEAGTAMYGYTFRTATLEKREWGFGAPDKRSVHRHCLLATFGDRGLANLETLNAWNDSRILTGRFQPFLLREILGNPFRPVPFSPSWRTDTVLALASQMYKSREFSAMPILGDALQDAGCDAADVLNHCRGPGPHVRGCWVVDRVLGKE